MLRNVPLALAATAALTSVVLGVIVVWRPNVLFVDLGSFSEVESIDEEIPAYYSLPVAFNVDDQLQTPSLDLLTRLAGDPKLQSGEIGFKIPILMYHHVRPLEAKFTAKDRRYTVTPESFKAQMTSLIAAGYHTITPDDLTRAMEQGWKVLPSKPVLLTFDDGLRDQYRYAFPILQQLKLKATFFVITGVFDSPAHFNQDMVRELDQSGLATIASHTMDHPYLTRLSSAAQVNEIQKSKQMLEELTDHPVTAFAYPFGSWNNALVKEVADAGYALGFGVGLGSLQASSSRYMIRRIPVVDRMAVVPVCDRFSRQNEKTVTVTK